MYVGVKLLYKHDGTPQGYLIKRFPALSLNDRRERSVGKVRQNNMALWMNAMFLKVLKEVLLGLPITEPNVKRGNGRIRRRRPGTKRVPSRSGFRFRCHAQSIRERERERSRERERERERERKRITNRTNRKKRKDTYA